MSHNQENYQSFDKQEELAEGKLVYNFSPGPCILPRAVLDQCQKEMINYRGTGQSVLEMGHRKPEYTNIYKMCQNELRKFLNIPDDYVIQINQGGATNQYTAVYKNLIGLKPHRKAMYLTTGMWSKQCITEVRKFIPPEKLIEVTNTSDSNHSQMTDPSTWKIDPEASYLHVCSNETVHGFEITEENFPWYLFPKDMVIVGDMSSNIGTRKINWNRFSVVYAGAQKNLGPSGSTVIIFKKSLLGKADKDTPVMCDWNLFENSPDGYYNTPPCYTTYVMALNISYMNQKGGIENYDRLSDVKSRMLYSVIDNSQGYYVNKCQKSFRSRVNVVFRIPGNYDLEKKMILEAEKVRIINIAGHSNNPGIRISMYNAMPIEGVVALCSFMKQFQILNPIIPFSNIRAKL